MGRNWFSFTAPEHPDLDLAWAFEVGVALLYRAGGFPAIVLGKTIAILAAFAGAFAICRRRGAGAVSATISLALAALAMRDRLVERPHVVSFAGEVIVLGAIAALGRPWSWRQVLAFALAMVAWANAHAGVFAGALMLGLAAVGAAPTDRAKTGRAALLGAFTVVAACVTPVGPLGMIRYLGLHVSLPRLHPIDEFRSATWRSDGVFLAWLCGVAAIVVVAYVRQRRAVAIASSSGSTTGDTLVDLLPAVGMAILGLASVRFAADAALVIAPLVATRASALWRLDPAHRLRAMSKSDRALPVLTVAALLVATGWPRVAEVHAGRRAIDLGIDSSTLPLDAIRFVEDNGLRERMYNDFEIGSYLLFQGFPRYRVFVDPRLPAYPEDMHRLLGSFELDRATWDAAMSKYGVETALLGYAGINRRVAWWDPERWALVYRASDARVFVRRRDRWRPLIAAREIPATFDFTVETGATTRPLETKPASSPVSDCEWQRRLGDLIFDLDRDNPTGAPTGAPTRARPYYARALAAPGCLASADELRLAAWMGALELGASDWQGALVHLDRALALSPGDTATRANRAIVLERVGRRADAAADWTRVGSEARGTRIGDAAATRASQLAPDR